MSVSPSPCRRSDTRARTDRHRGRGDRPDHPAEQDVQPEVVGELAGGERCHAGQRRLGRARAGRPPGDEGDRQEDGREREALVEHRLPRAGIHVSIETTKAPSSIHQSGRTTRSSCRRADRGGGRGAGGSTDASGSVDSSSRAEPGDEQERGHEDQERAARAGSPSTRCCWSAGIPGRCRLTTPMRIPDEGGDGHRPEHAQAAAATAATISVM